MKTPTLQKLAWLLPLLALTAAAWLRADEPPAPPAEQPAPATTPAQPAKETPAVAPEAPAAPESAPAVAPEEDAVAAAERTAEQARAEADKAVAAAEKAAEETRAQAEKIREDAETAVEKARAQADKARAEADANAEKARATVEKIKQRIPKGKHGKRVHTSDDNDRLVFGGENHILAGTVVEQDAVAVMGNLIIDGEVKGDAISVLGNNTINGHVQGDARSVVGNLTLGPKAVVDGELVCVVGKIKRDAGAIVRGGVEVQNIGPNIQIDSLTNWWDQALRVGRPLAIGAHLGWLWILTGFSVAFYALLGLVFPRKITACGDKLVESPGMVLLAAVLSVLALPVLFVLLCITVIGIPVALLMLPVGCLFMAMFGKAAIYGLVGRKLTGDRFHPALAVIIGALLFVLLYLMPVLGLLLALAVWFLGFGCAVLLMFGRAPKSDVVPPPAAAPIALAPAASPAPAAPLETASFAAAPAPAMQSDGFGAATPPPVAEPPPAPGAATFAAASQPTAFAPRVPVSADTLPRAGFWIRVAAALLDFIMIMVPLGVMGALDRGPAAMFIGVAAYSAAMWKLKGTTIGGVICNLKVVRLDDREIDWGVAVVRALSAFLSLFVAGLGFIWVAFDDEKQSWHDRIAGTTIVRVPKGTPLV